MRGLLCLLNSSATVVLVAFRVCLSDNLLSSLSEAPSNSFLIGRVGLKFIDFRIRLFTLFMPPPPPERFLLSLANLFGLVFVERLFELQMPSYFGWNRYREISVMVY